MAPAEVDDRRLLVGSILSTLVLGAVGVVWGIAARSQMILLDGVYAVIGIVLSWLLLSASALSAHGPTVRYPYGREAATPLAIGVQGLVILATLLYAAVEGVASIRSGGSLVTPGWAILYGAIAAAGSGLTWWWLRSSAAHSDVIAAEAAAWRVATLRGAGMVVGFSIMQLLIGSRYDHLAAYVDPVMVLITCVVLVGAPIRMVRSAVVELLEGVPGDHIQLDVRRHLADVASIYDLEEPELRLTKVGRKLYVEVDVVVGADVTVGQEWEVRQTLRDRLEALPFEIWLNLEFSPRTVG